MRVIFRCDASVTTGTGHVMRCLTLANKMHERGWVCSFSISRETLDTIPFLEARGFPLHVFENDSDDLAHLNNLLVAEKADLLIIDHYGRDVEFESAMRKSVPLIVVIDDLADRHHDCDILIDQTFGRSADDYKSLTPHNCKILTGTDYAMLAPQYMELRQKALEKRQQSGEVENILVSLGGTNLHNCTDFVLTALEECKGKSLSIDVVLGASAQNLEDIKEHIQNINNAGLHQVKLHISINNMHELMLKADLAIGAGGTTSWERCCLGLPTIVIELADNQKLIIEQLAKSGAILNVGKYGKFSLESLISMISDLCNNPAKIMEISNEAIKICDGKGTHKIIKEITNDHN